MERVWAQLEAVEIGSMIPARGKLAVRVEETTFWVRSGLVCENVAEAPARRQRGVLVGLEMENTCLYGRWLVYMSGGMGKCERVKRTLNDCRGKAGLDSSLVFPGERWIGWNSR